MKSYLTYIMHLITRNSNAVNVFILYLGTCVEGITVLSIYV